ncbi:Tex family protein [Planctobacterium marinum]|uniref:RNA-binding transcriptional accessory protein n=1 Tax=Planctobacterium marinum TaxID=1631968 RepID=A0AA48HMH7_9ALTE|nr:RNA-binding transcriptional accessory protein [Planctobacterium marinum]
MSNQTIFSQLSEELNISRAQINAAVELMDGGATVPFIARYRKEATQGLDDTQLRNLSQRLTYLRELWDRKEAIVKSIAEQDKLTPELKDKIDTCVSKAELEELYLPYKPKRRTKGQIAIENGLGPLADALFNDPDLDPETEAQKYLNEAVATTKDALDGARFILMERFAEDADLLQKIRQHLKKQAFIKSQLVTGKEKEAAKFSDYFEHREKLMTTPSHRALAMFRGRNEGFLQVSLEPDPEKEESDKTSYCETIIAEHTGLTSQHLSQKAAGKWLSGVIQWTWRIKILMYMENELFSQLRESAELEAINVFASNLKDLLMAAPAGPKVTMGLDPGLRTGVKVAVVDQTGKVLATQVIYPHAPQNHWDKSLRTLANVCRQHKVELVSIGNGTGSRETDKLVAELMKNEPELKLTRLIVSEAGASVYSASELASKELPEMDVSLRGAVSIARRLQDPLAELVKIEPKAIGVGQYQHDVSQSQLGQSLAAVIEDCVNAVGVDLNTASPAILANISGLNKTLAQNIVDYRNQNGAFSSRKELTKVARLGPKAFEQCAGFLRINEGNEPLDASAVHPEAYPVVERIQEQAGCDVKQLIGNADVLKKLLPEHFVDDHFGLPTVKDIFSELLKPGRDPRPEFKTAQFKEGIDTINDLKPGMILEGVISNVANFGAFVDIGVHQDGLVHISCITDKFISDPREVVKAGDIVKVKVTDVDVQRKRISLTMRLDDKASTNNNQANKAGKRSDAKPARHSRPPRQDNKSSQNSAMGNAFAEAFAKAKK